MFERLGDYMLHAQRVNPLTEGIFPSLDLDKMTYESGLMITIGRTLMTVDICLLCTGSSDTRAVGQMETQGSRKQGSMFISSNEGSRWQSQKRKAAKHKLDVEAALLPNLFR